jgi:hypothetical protein
MLNQWRTEGRMARLVIGAAVVVFLALIAIVGPFFRSFDEAKYLGIGYSMLAGDGPKTVFGSVFLPHSPLWPTILAAPDVWFHIDPFAWGQLLNAISGADILLLVGWLGWRFRPAVGALAIAGYLAIPYLQDLTRTARLDVPAAALVLAYLVVGIEAVRRDSVRWALVAGGIFAAAFLVKEIVLPVAPVPFLVGLLIGRPLATLARVAAATLLVAVAGTAWWFIEFAGYTREVYRLGAPDRWLVPLYVGAAVAVVVGLAAPWLVRQPAARRLSARIEARLPADRGRRLRTGAAWGLALLWFLAFVVFFARNPELKGVGLVSPSQYGLYVRTWLPTLVLKVLAAVLGLGVVLGFAARWRMAGRPAEWFDSLVLSLLCSAPLVMLVVAVGEPPRNYLAQIGLIVVLSSIGWLHALGWYLARRGSRALVIVPVALGAVVVGFGARVTGSIPTVVGAAAGAAIGLLAGAWWAGIEIGGRRLPGSAGIEPEEAPSAEAPSAAAPSAAARPRDSPSSAQPVATRPDAATAATSRTWSGPLAVIVVATFVVAAVSLTGHALATRESGSGAVRAAAVSRASSWIEGHVPAGSRIGFGSFLGYETAVDLAGRYSMVQIHQSLAVVDPAAPLGLAQFGAPPVDDWIAIDVSRREREFYAFRASTFGAAVIKTKIAYYVYLSGPNTSVPALLGALTAEHGFRLVDQASFSTVSPAGVHSTTEFHVFAVDPARVDLTGSSLFATPLALDRLVGLLVDDPATLPATAVGLAARATTWPDAAASTPILDRLRTLSAR